MNLDRYKAILCDLDGCLLSGDRVLPGARTLLERAGDRLVILSNNSTDTPASLSARLAHLGLSTPAERIFLAGVGAVDHVAARHPGRRINLFGSRPLLQHALSLGLRPDGRTPETVLLARDVTFSYAKLTQILDNLRGGADLVVANPDLTHPGAQGEPVPETGSVLRWITACLPDPPITLVGKPEPALYSQILTRFALSPGDCLCLGDNPDTDGEGARRMGMAFAHVRQDGGRQGIADLLTEDDDR
jgi:HAD superfamily hydrolase (TIGR01450 family)